MNSPEENGAAGVEEDRRKTFDQQAADGADHSARREAPASEGQQQVTEARSDGSAADDGKPSSQNTKPRGKPILKRPIFWIFVVIAIVALIAGFAYYWIDVRPYASTDDAYIGADIVQLAPQTSGQVVTDAVTNNTHVKAGDLLLKIDDATANASVASAQAQLEQAKANLLQAQAGVDQASSQQAQAEAQADAAAVTASNDQDTLRRDEQLFKSSSAAISQKQVDNDRATARGSEAQARASQKAVGTAKTSVEAAKAKVTSAEASVRAAESQVNTARINLGYTTIKAPISGQVVQKNFNIGTYASTGTPLMAIVPDRLYIDANYKETQLSEIRVGQPVDIKVDAFPDIDFKGKVISIQHGAGQAFQVLPPQNATGNFVKVVQRVPVRIEITSPDPSKYPIGPGMSVVTSIRKN